MLPIHSILESAQILLDHSGNRTAIQLDWKTWEQLQELLEDLEDIRELKAAQKETDASFDWDDVVAEYEAQHSSDSDV